MQMRTVVLMGLAASTLMSAAPAPAAPVPAAASPVARLEAAPAQIELVGPRARQAVVVTAVLQNGLKRDVTGAAELKLKSAGTAVLTSEGYQRLLKPVADGATSLAVSFGGKSLSLPVAVSGQQDPRPVSFRNEVVPALTKAGCNQGLCHGTPTGKGGFRLSLQGYAPELDYKALIVEGGSRRVNKADPGRSLLLLKPMVAVPHAGGQRLTPEMPEYEVLTRWIAEGAQDDPAGAPVIKSVELLPGPRQLKLPAAARQRLVAMATFSDGSKRDVTHLAKLTTSDEETTTVTRDGLVTGTARGDVAILARYGDAMPSMRLTFLRDVPGFKWTPQPEQNLVDGHVFNRLKLMQIPASGVSSDHEFVRRAFIDSIGLLPTADETRSFVADTDPQKRTKLIDALTQRPEFADHWALRWADVLRIADESLSVEGAKAYHAWLRDSLAKNRPLSEVVKEMLTSRGPSEENPPVNFFRAIRNQDDNVSAATVWSEGVAQLFLGVRLTCARCHNHPFERWTQDDYYSLAAFFAPVRLKGDPKKQQNLLFDRRGKVEHLRTGQVMKPKMLGGPQPEVAVGEDPRVALAEWLTEPGNPFFARSVVNRTWANLLGRGIVEPIDDFRESNPPVNEELLAGLASHFVKSGFDFRDLVRTIMKSRTYQLSSMPVALNADDGKYFSHSYARLLTAEQLSDAIGQITGVPEQFEGYPVQTRAAQVAGTGARTAFLKTFGRPERNLTCECEREKDPTLFQAMALISGRTTHNRVSSDEGRLAKLAAGKRSDAEIVDELYLAAFARPPSQKERTAWLAHFAKASNRRSAVEDLGWVLINSKEFLFRR